MQEKDIVKDVEETVDAMNTEETVDTTNADDTVTNNEEVVEEASDETANTTEETADDTAKEATNGSESSEKKKSFFKKDKKDKKDEKIEELNDQLIRTLAEFDNFRKRSEREKSQMFEVGAKDIIERMLPIIDNFERGLATVSEEEKQGAFAQGIEKIYKQLVTSLEEAGVKYIDAVGKEFDPNFHNAVMHTEDDTLEANIVSKEFQKGYMYRESVVRHSMVEVAN